MKKSLRLLSTRGFTSVGTFLVSIVLIATASADLKVLDTKLDGGVPNANPRLGTPDSIVPPRFSLSLIVEGIDLLENPSGVISRFGLLSDATNTRTEPDEN